MKFRITLLAASLSAALATSLAASGPVGATAQGNSNPVINPALSSKVIASLQTQNTAHGFTVSSQHVLPDGTLVHRLRHTYQNLPVFGSESVLVTDADGKLLSQTHADLRQGLPGTGNKTASLNLQPALTGAEAIARLRSQVPGAQGLLVDVHAPSAELLIYPHLQLVRTDAARNKAEADLNAMDLQEVVQSHELAWHVKLQGQFNGKPLYREAIVSASSGAILKQWDALQTVAGTGTSHYSGSVPVETTLSAGVYRMIDSSRGTGNTFGGATVLDFKSGSSGVVFARNTNVWGTVANEVDGVDAGWALRNAYDLLKNTESWKSLDGKNTAVYIGVHYGSGFANAFYDDTCKCMKIGDATPPLTTLDIIGHELGHGVTAATANLVYSGESGGLNEAASDMFGEMVEAYGKSKATGSTIPATGNDWVLGKEAYPNGLRTMYKPSKDGMSPDFWSSRTGQLDVHYASGPANRMFYFLSKGSSATTTSDYYSRYLTQSPKAMVGIGNDKAYKIWFRALTTKFTSSTNYAAAQKACVQAATELYGATSKEVIAVKRAFAAVNVGADVTGG